LIRLRGFFFADFFAGDFLVSGSAEALEAAIEHCFSIDFAMSAKRAVISLDTDACGLFLTKL